MILQSSTNVQFKGGKHSHQAPKQRRVTHHNPKPSRLNTEIRESKIGENAKGEDSEKNARGQDREENTKGQNVQENAKGQDDQDDLIGHNCEPVESVIDETSAHLRAS